MMIELPVLISIIAAVSGIVFGVISAVHASNASRNQESARNLEDFNTRLEQAEKRAAERGEMKALLTDIRRDTGDIKAEQKSLRGDLEEMNRRLIVVEESTKSAHKRIDTLNNTFGFKDERQQHDD